MTMVPDPDPDLLAIASAYLRDAHLLRGGAYLGTAATVLQSLAQYFPQRMPYGGELLHLTVLPLTLAITRAFAQLRPEDQARWAIATLPEGLIQTGQGAALGAAAILTTLGIARAKGWVSAPAWGWAQADSAQLARSVALLTIGNLAVAWNEELVFRGYGHSTLQLAMPEPMAGALLTILFALAHPLTPRALAGEAALGLALLALRVRSDGIWAAVGYHWAWNALQTAVFGPVDGPPSLRPLHAHGPLLWLGRPGYTEPGLLSTGISLVVALTIILWPKPR